MRQPDTLKQLELQLCVALDRCILYTFIEHFVCLCGEAECFVVDLVILLSNVRSGPVCIYLLYITPLRLRWTTECTCIIYSDGNSSMQLHVYTSFATCRMMESKVAEAMSKKETLKARALSAETTKQLNESIVSMV